MSSVWFSPSTPRVLAHRGLAKSPGVAENTIPAFRAAWAAGARYLETDVRGTADGVAVLMHDETLTRLLGDSRRVGDVTFDELARMSAPVGGIPTLAEALEALPGARWNIDVKDAAGIAPAARDIRRAGAEGRVLIASFRDRRSRDAHRLLPHAVRSPGRARMAWALLGCALRITPLVRLALRGYGAVQIPERYRGVPVLTRGMLALLPRVGVEIHVWTVNDAPTMRRLLRLGVDGIITDRADLALRVVAETNGNRK